MEDVAARNNKLIKAAKQGQKRRADKAQGHRRVIGIEALVQRQADFIQKVIDSVWKSDFSHLSLDIFASPKRKVKSPRKMGPNQRTWLTATKDFRSIGLDIFTMDIELAAPSSIQEEQASPKKRKAKDQGIVPAKRRRQADGPAIVVLAPESALQSRARRVIRRTDKAKASY